jgi:toxin ParE1/3/4
MKMINDYISIDSEFYAEKFINKIHERTSILEIHTHIGKVVPEFNDQSIRELIEDPYRIIYKVESDDEIFIVRVHHSSRLLRKL